MISVVTSRGGLIIDGDTTDEVLAGSSSDDLIKAYAGNDTVVGGRGDDYLWGDDGIDTVVFAGLRSQYQIDGDQVRARVVGPDGSDFIFDFEFVRFDDGTFSLASLLPIRATGSGGPDLLIGGAYDDVLEGLAGDDTLIGGDGSDHLIGGAGNDRLDGGFGNDLLQGEDGDDVLLGGAGDDQLQGGIGNDWLIGGSGNDLLFGGEGENVASFSGRREQYKILGSRGVLSVSGPDGEDTLYDIDVLRFDDGIVTTARPTTIYRFFDTIGGRHFYTGSEVERDTIKAGLPTMRYEGAQWSAPAKSEATTDVFRFFNTKDGGHLYTTSVVERDTIQATLPFYAYEGVAFQAFAPPGAPGAMTLERFFNKITGAHHFAASEGEVAGLKAGAGGPGWVDEGPGLVVSSPGWLFS